MRVRHGIAWGHACQYFDGSVFGQFHNKCRTLACCAENHRWGAQEFSSHIEYHKSHWWLSHSPSNCLCNLQVPSKFHFVVDFLQSAEHLLLCKVIVKTHFFRCIQTLVGKCSSKLFMWIKNFCPDISVTSSFFFNLRIKY